LRARTTAVPRRIVRLALVGGLGWAALGLWPYAQGALLPPAGRRSSGFFFYQNDQYLYLSFAEQAMRGAFVFENKFDLRPHEPFLINLGWWLVGRLGAVFGGTVVGMHVLGAAATVLLAYAVSALLHRGGCSRPGWGLALYATGGGLGVLRLVQGAPFDSVVDLTTGIFPTAVKLLGVAHNVLGSALWLLSLLWHVEWRAGQRRRSWWLLSAAALGLVRPYDLALLALSAGGLLLRDLVRGLPLRAVVARGAEWLWLTPVFLYLFLAFVAHPSFSLFSGAQHGIVLPSASAFAAALLPAAALAGWGLLRPAASSEGSPAPSLVGRELRAALLFVVGGVGLVLLLPIPFAFEFVGALGAALLLLVALGVPPGWLPAAALGLCPTTLVLLWRLLNPQPEWFPPRDLMEVNAFLRRECRPGQRVVAPESLAVLVAGTGPCRAVLGHRVLTPEVERRVDEAERFYSTQTSPLWRRTYLRQVGADWVVVAPGRRAALGLEASAAPAFSTRGLEVWRVGRR